MVLVAKLLRELLTRSFSCETVLPAELHPVLRAVLTVPWTVPSGS